MPLPSSQYAVEPGTIGSEPTLWVNFHGMINWLAPRSFLTSHIIQSSLLLQWGRSEHRMPCWRAVPESRAVLNFITFCRSFKSHDNLTCRFKFVTLSSSSPGCIPTAEKLTPVWSSSRGLIFCLKNNYLTSSIKTLTEKTDWSPITKEKVVISKIETAKDQYGCTGSYALTCIFLITGMVYNVNEFSHGGHGRQRKFDLVCPWGIFFKSDVTLDSEIFLTKSCCICITIKSIAYVIKRTLLTKDAL